MPEYANIHNLERFCNKAFDLRNNYIISLIDEAYKQGLSQEAVALWLVTSRNTAEELLEYAKATNFQIGDNNISEQN